MSAAYIQVHFRLDFYMEANNMNTDQTAPLLLFFFFFLLYVPSQQLWSLRDGQFT